MNSINVRKHPLSIAIATLSLCGFSSMAYGKVTVPQTPFANVPLNLQQTTTTMSGNRPKPNMMLFIDDSGSMGWKVDKHQFPSPGEESRLSVTQGALRNILTNVDIKDKFHWSIYTLHGSAYTSQFTDANTVLYQINSKLKASGVTPATTRYLGAAQKVIDGLKYRCQKSYIIMMSDGDANDDWYPNHYTPDSSMLGNYFKNKNYWSDFWPKSSQPGRSPNWGISSAANWTGELRKGGFGTRASSTAPYYGAGLSFYTETLAHKDFKKGGTTDADGVDWDADGPDKIQTLKTYTIGLGPDFASGGPACRYLRNAATKNPNDPKWDSSSTDYDPSLADPINEPACPTNDKGRFFFTAQNKADLEKAFKAAVEDAKADSVGPAGGESTVSTSTPSTAGTNIPELAAYFSLDTTKWASALYFNAIDSGTGAIDNTDKKPAAFPAKHPILVNTGSETYRIDDPAVDSGFYGIKTDVELRMGLIPWLTRPSNLTDEQIEAQVKGSVDVADRTVTEYRKRTDSATDILRQMSDVIGSPTIAVEQDKYIVTAANDGLVYIFKRSSDPNHPYELALNYLPGAMQRESKDDSDTVAKAIRAVAETGYGKEAGQPHLFLNDGGIVYRTTPDTAGAGKQSFVVGAMGKGGRGVYALNIGGKDRTDPTKSVALDAGNILATSPSGKVTDVPLWESEKGENNMLGYTVGTPQIGQIATKWNISGKDREPNYSEGVRFYAFLGNGYSTNSSGTNAPTLDTQPTLYVYEALGQEAGMSGAKVDGDKPGTLVAKVSVAGGHGGLATPTLLDSDFDGIVDTAYAGDYAGNLYRFDLKNEPGKWEAVKIYQGLETVGASGNTEYTQPITSAPAVYRRSDNEFVVIFGTGSDLYQSDLNNTDQQAVIGIFDDISKKPASAVAYNDLEEQSIKKTDVSHRYLTDNAVDINKDKGWKLLLDSSSGERVVVKPQMLLSTAFLSTRSYKVTSSGSGTTPPSSKATCLATTTTVKTDGESWIMAVNALTGGSPNIETGAYFSGYSGIDPSGNKTGDPVGGMKTFGLASAVVLYNYQSVSNSSTDPNGDSGGSGEGVKIDGKKKIESNECLTSDGYNALYSDKGGPKNITLEGLLCPTSIIRLNYREVPL